MGSLFINLLAQIGSYASIIGLYVTMLPPGQGRPEWHWGLISITGFLTAYLMWREVVKWRQDSPKTYRDQRRINDYMCRWVASGGRVAIFSRDMSWAEDEKVRAVLLKKAGRNELTVCVEHPTGLTSELEQRGASIICYGKYNIVPRSRFTIVDFERQGARVAIGMNQDGRHIIQEFQYGKHPLFAVAEDMIKILQSI